MINIEELKIEFEEKFYDDDDESNILIASKKDIWEWIKNKVQQQVKVEPEVIVKTVEEIEEKYPCEKGCMVTMEEGLTYEQILQANYYRLEGALWATGNENRFSK